MQQEWTRRAMAIIGADFNRSSDTHLIRVDLPFTAKIQLYLKDESTHPTGSLKHRLARSLFLYGLCNGWIHAGTTVIETSSGSTAISEAYFARLLGLPFIAVIPRSTSSAKIEQIAFYGGQVHLVDEPTQIYAEAQRLARECDGHYIDQFTYAERATDWRGNNNIAESIFEQMAQEPFPEPTWVVVGAGTGGTSATIGRYIRYTGRATQLCVVDPTNSVFFDYYQQRDQALTLSVPSAIEGIGRPRVEPSFVPEIIDRMLRVPDAASFAAVRLLAEVLGRRCGPSTGTNLCGALELICAMHAHGEDGSVVSLICDSGERYHDTCYSDAWLTERGHAWEPHLARLRHAFEHGEWSA